MQEPPQRKSDKQSSVQLKLKNTILQSKNFISALLFTWITPVLSYGTKTILEQQDIPDLPPKMKTANQSQQLMKQLDIQLTNGVENKEGVKLLKAITKASKSYAPKVFFSYLFCTVSSMALPILVNKIISYIEVGEKTVSMSLIFISLVFLAKFVYNVSLSYLCYKMAVFGFTLSNNLGLCVFNKALKFPTLCNKSITIAELINYTEVDAQRLSDVGWNTSALIFCPTMLIFGIVMMYNFIGLPFLSGMIIFILVSIAVYFITKYQTRANDTLLKSKDQRMKVTTQIFNHIRFIKSNAWQKYYFNKLNRARNDELSKIKKVKLFNVLEILLMWLAIPLSLSATFGTYVYLGNQMSAQVAFTTIVLFDNMEYPINALPGAIGQLSQTWSSIKRLEKFFKAQQMQDAYVKEQNDCGEAAIKIQNGSFYWERQQEKQQQNKQKTTKKKKKKADVQKQDQQDQQNRIKQSLLTQSSIQVQDGSVLQVKALRNINTTIKKGKLTIILGNIGSGKSSLLYSILGEMKAQPQSNAQIQIDGSVVFVPQKPWMMSRNIEQNILMTLQKDSNLFNKAIKFSCLQDDVKQFPDGVKTVIGEKGINLSGGQKARVSLARALYSNKDIYLLDDIISAVDVHVGNSIIKDCILDYLKGKTVVLVTHAIAFAKYADQIIIMKKGEIVQQGPYQDLKDKEYFKEIQKLESQKSKLDSDSEEEPGQLQTPSLAHQVSLQSERGQTKTTTNTLVEDLLMPQDRSRGSVQLKTYMAYIRLNGGWAFVTIIFIAMTLYVVLSVLGNIQIQRWCQHPQEGFKDLYIYMGFTIMAGVFAASRAMILIFSGIKQGSFAHKKMMKGLMYASVPEFFDRVPTGRILNRVSKDLRQLDQNIGNTLGGVLVSSFSLVGQLVICVYASTPYILIPLILFFIICYFCKNYFMRCQRQVVRLQTISNSPVISSFTQVVNGLPSIRAYNLCSSFLKRQSELVDINKRNKVTRQAVECWFAQRLSFMSLIINISATAYCLFSNQSNPSMAGLLLAYSFSIDESIIWLTYSLAELQTKMVSVERVSNFMNIQSEKGYIEYTKKWRTRDQQTPKMITQGKVQFKDLSLKYRENLPSVLKSINFQIQAGQKIGVVGRTGAGKSTIIQSLLRMVEPTEGQIRIDGQQIRTIPLKSLRTSLTLIAQEPVLIGGTLRENLDPRNEHTEQKLLQALEKCYLMQTFKQRQLLQTKISESGQNLSIGEKQLICIARAILRQNKLVLIDEATANIDMTSDKLIQKTIRECFSSSTVITIAHRIKTILDSSRILVLEKGRVAEFDTPERLLQRKGIFHEMYQKSLQENEL